MGAAKHTAGLHRGYADNVRIDWDNRKGGFSSISLLNAKRRPVAILLGDYVPGELDTDLDAAARLFCAAPDLLAVAIKSHEPYEGLTDADVIDLYGGGEAALCLALRAAIAKATGAA